MRFSYRFVGLALPSLVSLSACATGSTILAAQARPDLRAATTMSGDAKSRICWKRPGDVASGLLTHSTRRQHQ